jgi:hypothetical protein
MAESAAEATWSVAMIVLSRQPRNKLDARHAPFASPTISSRASDAQLPPPGAARDTGTMHRISGPYTRTEGTPASHTPRENGA